MNNDIEKVVVKAKSNLEDVVLKELRGSIKEEVLSTVKEVFTPVCEDYESFISRASELDKSQVSEWVDFLIKTISDDYDLSIQQASFIGNSLKLNISLVKQDLFGFNTSEHTPLSWLFFYVSGQRYSSFFISSSLLEEKLDSIHGSPRNPIVRLINYSLNSRIGEFGDGFLITPQEFNAPNTEFDGIRWSDFLTEEEVTPSVTQNFETIVEDISSAISQVISTSMSDLLNSLGKNR